MRAIFEFSAENAKIADCLADDAVRCELLSGSNSLIIRENTGNFFIFESEEPLRPPNYVGSVGVFSANSLLNGAGNFNRRTGNYFTVSGNFQGGAGKFIWRAARRETPVFLSWMEF
jgi:hypothetical protein